jgi:hypothetical protein
MLQAAFQSASIAPCVGQTRVSCRGLVQCALQRWQVRLVSRGSTLTTRRPAPSALATRIEMNWPQPASRMLRFSPALAATLRPGSTVVPLAERVMLAVARSSTAMTSELSTSPRASFRLPPTGTVAVDEVDRAPSSSGLESGIASPSTGPNSVEEPLKGSIKAAQRLLLARKRPASLTVRVSPADRGELCGLVAVTDRHAMAPGFPTLLQCGVVQLAVGVQARLGAFPLCASRVGAELMGAAHAVIVTSKRDTQGPLDGSRCSYVLPQLAIMVTTTQPPTTALSRARDEDGERIWRQRRSGSIWGVSMP